MDTHRDTHRDTQRDIHRDTHRDGQRSVFDLFGDLVEQTSTLFRKEVQLAKAEVSEKVGQVGSAISQVGIGAVFMVAALVLLLQAIVYWLAYFDVPERVGALIVGIVVAIIGAVLLKKGSNAVSAANLAPVRTTEQLQRDAAVVKEKTR
ncbi:phage holin family protein [Chthonobacter rhizosphaerae]|uniref:phage holin family protein n=1 Tax=Chthonobacter rhizosphaerae TaxID=2735553 RepID=UPI0015EF908E|nr:phage holin family protein [Chthonobacter rhizosphaerae]